ncbi:hypothetical protein [Roseofilum capinflatum]|uniref:Uncharacterized protein n=1 Tax=Roseofilum capinflatum BLCC-M114 TaxID=3022440 RepID=A0ABT7B2J9_9CYAN|nr:hypothetical protein [Roseofilum capinflatum]MDJ1173360.1 hypothetical protein [Roseofilum capinflatum BLCC-M114]
MKKAQESEQPRLFIPYCRQPFLEYKKKTRGKNREGFKLIEEAVSLFEVQLQRNDIQSPEVQAAVHEFVQFVQGK